MRTEMSPAEKLLWQHLRGDQFLGLRFRRQHRIGNYIVDFFCPELNLTIELDGDSHSEQVDYDQKRTRELAEFGTHVLRFDNPDVFEHTDAVLREIERMVDQIRTDPSPPPSPRVRGEGESVR
jgi:very-short-patch-repair endonuclease